MQCTLAGQSAPQPQFLSWQKRWTCPLCRLEAHWRTSKPCVVSSGALALGQSSAFKHEHAVIDFKELRVSTARPLSRVTQGYAPYHVGNQLASKYSLPPGHSQQLVVSTTNLWTYEQSWFNQARNMSRTPTLKKRLLMCHMPW
jgi:hypothetical protein